MSPMSFIRLGARAAAHRRYLHTTIPLRIVTTPNKGAEGTNSVQHTTDSYAKDIDDTPAPDHQVHRIDPSSENVQKPYEAPSGEWSRAGVKTSEYTSVNKSDQPYTTNEPKGEKPRYGGRSSWAADKGEETSHPGEGPTGTDAGGRR